MNVIERPGEDPTCEHGRALDVHCCGCHSGFLFDAAACTCLSGNDSLGLSIDMLDVDRLRQWANNLLVYGSDISQWGDRIYVAGKMQQIATSIEHAVKDIGTLRAALALSPPVSTTATR